MSATDNKPKTAFNNSANHKNTGKTGWGKQAIAIITSIIIVLAALVLFVWANTSRITEQNESYLQGSTEQAARRVNDLLERSLDIVETAAAIYETSVDPKDIPSPEKVAHSLKITSFDYTFFITPDGFGYRDDRDKDVDVSDRIYYIDGMKGKSGIVAYPSGAWYDKNVLIFYAPIIYDGEVLGVFAGAYKDKTIADYYMTAEYFGHITPTYLFSTTGEILARSETAVQDVQTLGKLLDSGTSSVSAKQIHERIENDEPVSFSYEINGSSGSAYLVKLADYDWALMREFPSEITENMVWNASISGFILVGGVLIAAVIIIIMAAREAKRKREALMFENRQAERIIDTSTELFHSMLTVDLATGAYEYLAPAHSLRDVIPDRGNIEDLTRTLSSMSEGKYKESILDDLSLETMKRKLAANENGRGFYQFEHHLYDPANGNAEQWMQANVMTLSKNDKGEIETALIAAQDVTDVKKREIDAHVALTEAYHAAEYASKAKSDFLNSMSHDIRTPMNSIIGLTAIASMHINDSNRVSECLTNISAASHHLLGLINEVLDMAKIESGNISLSEESFDLPELVEGMFTIIHPQIEAKHQQLDVEVDFIEHEHVIGDPTRLQQVFINIMGNAVKFTPEGGKVTFRAQELESRVRGMACYHFEFEDNGIGMSEEFLETIFEPFARAHDTRTQKTEGSGLGMSIVKNVVDLMSGNIYVESEEGKGTKFTVTVNLRIDEEAFDAQDKVSGRAIVIDDDLNTCEIACAMLADIGMESEYRTGGQEGIDAVLEADEADNAYDIVLLDWKMPVMSGVEVAREIRESSKKHVPIIIFSGYDWSVIEEEAKSAGVDVFVMKPLFRSRLLKLIKEMLSGETENPLDQSQLLVSCNYQGKRILLAEDNLMASEIAIEIIETTGAEVTHAENGQVAYETARDSEPGHFDLVLMDIQMPIKNGYEATKSIRAEKENGREDLAEIPIVALSADAFEDDIKRALDAGMNAHLAKPLDITALVKTMRKYIDGEEGE